MPWLLRDDRVLASLEIASTRRERRRGLLGRDGFDGALLIDHARSVHTIGMRFPIDVAHLDAEGTVLRCGTMPRHRVGLPVLRARQVLEEAWKARPHPDLAESYIGAEDDPLQRVKAAEQLAQGYEDDAIRLMAEREGLTHLLPLQRQVPHESSLHRLVRRLRPSRAA